MSNDNDQSTMSLIFAHQLYVPTLFTHRNGKKQDGQQGDFVIIHCGISKVWLLKPEQFYTAFNENPTMPGFLVKDPAASPELCEYPFSDGIVLPTTDTTEALRTVDTSTFLNGNLYDMSDAQFYRKRQHVLAFVIPQEVTFFHTTYHQSMKPWDIVIVDPATCDLWGCEGPTFAETYRAVEGKWGFYQKIAKVQAVQMPSSFFVRSIDKQDHPEYGKKGDFLVKTIRIDSEKDDRYKIARNVFQAMYEETEE